MAKKQGKDKSPTYNNGVLDELVVIAPKISTKHKKGTWDYVKERYKKHRQTAYTRDTKTGKRTSDIVVTEPNVQNSYFTDPIDGHLIRRGNYSYRNDKKDNSFTSGVKNHVNFTAAGLIDLASYAPYAVGHALNALGSPVGKDLIRTSKDWELDARRINRYEVAPSDFWSMSTLGSFIPSLGLAAVTGGNSLYLDANTARATTKNITKDLGGSTILANILGSTAGTAALLPIGGAKLQGTTKQALTQYLKSAAQSASLGTGIGTGVAAAPQLFTGDYEGALNTASTIAPIIAGSSILSSGLPKAAAYKGYDALTRKYLNNLHASDEVWAASRQNLPWFISKKQADRARQLFIDLNDSTSKIRDRKSSSPWSLSSLHKGHKDGISSIPFHRLVGSNPKNTSLIIPEVANLFEDQIVSRINGYIDPSYLSTEDKILQEALQQSQRLTGKSINARNVQQTKNTYEGTGIRDALLRKILQSVYNADDPEQGTTGHYLKQSNPTEYDNLISSGTQDISRIDRYPNGSYIDNPVLSNGILYNYVYPNYGFNFKSFYRNGFNGLKDPTTQEVLNREMNFGVLFNDDKWNLNRPAKDALTPYTQKDVLDLIAEKAAITRKMVEEDLNKLGGIERGPLINKFAKKFNEVKGQDEQPLQILKIPEIASPKAAHNLFSRGLNEDILTSLGLNIDNLDPKNIPLHTRAISGEGAIDDMINSGVIRSKYGANGDVTDGSRTSTVFRHNMSTDKLEAEPLYTGRGMQNSTPISQYTSPDFDLRTGRLSHYVKFDGSRNGGLGGNIVAVANPNAMGGEYYQIGKPHGTSFGSVLTPSKALAVEGMQGTYIPSDNTFEYILQGINDYKNMANYWGNVAGASYSNPNIGTIHRTFGKKLGDVELDILRKFNVDEPLISKMNDGSNPIVPIAPPIEAMSIFEFVNPTRLVDGIYTGGKVRRLRNLNFDIDHILTLGEPKSKVRPSHDITSIVRSEKLKNFRLLQLLKEGSKLKRTGEEGLYLLPNSEMQRFVDAMKKKDPNYGTSEITIGDKTFRFSNQF